MLRGKGQSAFNQHASRRLSKKGVKSSLSFNCHYLFIVLCPLVMFGPNLYWVLVLRSVGYLQQLLRLICACVCAFLVRHNSFTKLNDSTVWSAPQR